MPLRKPISAQADIIDDTDLLRGVRFAMYDGQKQVICTVSYEALGDRARADGARETTRETFVRCRSRIEQIASENYDSGEASPLVKSHELNG
jgi:hypothetical protein